MTSPRSPAVAAHLVCSRLGRCSFAVRSELGLPLVVVIYLTPDLAGRECRVVDVHIGHAGADRAYKLRELARRYPLPRRPDDIAYIGYPGHNGFGGGSRRAGRLRAAAAEEYGHTARGEAVTEVDMRDRSRGR